MSRADQHALVRAALAGVTHSSFCIHEDSCELVDGYKTHDFRIGVNAGGAQLLSAKGRSFEQALELFRHELKIAGLGPEGF